MDEWRRVGARRNNTVAPGRKRIKNKASYIPTSYSAGTINVDRF